LAFLPLLTAMFAARAIPAVAAPARSKPPDLCGMSPQFFDALEAIPDHCKYAVAQLVWRLHGHVRSRVDAPVPAGFIPEVHKQANKEFELELAMDRIEGWEPERRRAPRKRAAEGRKGRA
jgi:hypothetical protein